MEYFGNNIMTLYVAYTGEVRSIYGDTCTCTPSPSLPPSLSGAVQESGDQEAMTKFLMGHTGQAALTAASLVIPSLT